MMGYAYEIMARLSPPKSLPEKIELITHLYSYWYVFGTPKNQLPAIVQDIYTQQGRKLVVLIVVAIIIGTVLE